MIAASHKFERFTLLLGDVFFLYTALFVTLVVRYLSFPTRELLAEHVVSFSILFLIWIVVFYLAGLYDKQTMVLKGKLPGLIFKVQVINVAIAALFFFLTPFFSIAPKTNLLIYLVISFALMMWWRLSLSPLLTTRKKQSAILVGAGTEVAELHDEIHFNPRYGLSFACSIDPTDMSPQELALKILEAAEQTGSSFIVLDLHHTTVREASPELYPMLFRGVQFFEMGRLFEDVFDRLPVSLLPHEWLVSNISTSPSPVYDVIKRTMDIVGSVLLGIPSLLLYPFIIAALALEGKGPFFIMQERVGQSGRTMTLIKFRTMTGVDTGSSVLESKFVVTRVGKILRELRLDEIPQLWNIFRGDLSFIGPRPELPALADVYAKEVPYYHVRHLIKPGLSGWAQINHQAHPHHGADITETKNKLSYDLFYVKERSVFLDLHIALQTVKIIFSRSGA